MITVTVLFLVLNLPYDLYTLKTGLTLQQRVTPLETAVNQLFFNTMVFLSYLNSSINFICYFVSGRKFRAAAMETFACRWHR